MIKNLGKKINNIFITGVLTLFYFLIIGIAYLLKLLIHRKKENTSTYWGKVKNIHDFSSPY